MLFNCCWFFLTDKEGDKKSQKIIQELENIDDECEEKEIDFVKTSDEGTEKEFGIPTLPALAFYKNKFKKIYTGTGNCCHKNCHNNNKLQNILNLQFFLGY